MSEPSKTVWPCLNYRDARAAIGFLVEAFGFEEALVVPGEDDGVVAHSQLRWPEGGGVMLGTAGREDSEFARLPTSCASVYVVTDDPHAVFDRATAGGRPRGARDARRGLRLDGLQRARPRGQHLELRHVPRRGLTPARRPIWARTFSRRLPGAVVLDLGNWRAQIEPAP